MLYTHGEKTITRTELANFPVPTIEQLRSKKGEDAGNRWAPQPFIEVANAIEQVATARGLKIKGEHYNVSKDGFDVFGCVEFEGLVEGRGDMGPVLGWRMSNMQRFKLLGVSGARVFVCNNGAIVGDFCFGHKLTNGMEREVTIDNGMRKWQDQQRHLQVVYNTMEQIELASQEQVDHLLMESVRRDIFSPSQLGKIDAEFRSDRSKTQFGERPTVRRLYEATTEVAKTWGSPRVVERGMRGFPDLALRIYGQEKLAAALTEGGLQDFELN